MPNKRNAIAQKRHAIQGASGVPHIGLYAAYQQEVITLYVGYIVVKLAYSYIQIKVTLPDPEPTTTLDSEIARLSWEVGRKFTGNHSIFFPSHVIQQPSLSSPHPDSIGLLTFKGRLGSRRISNKDLNSRHLNR
jgi:hypothetical protein